MSDVKTLYNQLTHAAQRDLLTTGVVAFNLGKPAVEDDDNCVALEEMKNGAYTIAAQPDVPRNIVAEVEQDTAPDTKGKVVITGYDILGNKITEEITPGADSTAVPGNKAFASVESIIGSGWAASNAGDEDSIKFGYGEKIGLPIALSTIDNVLLCLFDRAVDAATAAVGDPPTVAETTLIIHGTYNGAKVMQVLVRPE